MKAPEKIYVALDEIDDLALDHRFDYPICTEYTCTDAFIKRACDAYCKVCKMPNCRRNECKMIEDFRNCIKG